MNCLAENHVRRRIEKLRKRGLAKTLRITWIRWKLRAVRTNADEAVPNDKAQQKFTDPESKIMKTSNKGFDQCGNARVVATEDQVIMAADVTNQANDVYQVEPLIDQLHSNVAAANLDCTSKEFLADSSYFSEANVAKAEASGLDLYIATQCLKPDEELPESVKSRTSGDLIPKLVMARKPRTKKGKKTYATRKWMMEPVLGQIKACRSLRQFLPLSLKKRQGEWTLVCLTHNLLKAFLAKASRTQRVATAYPQVLRRNTANLKITNTLLFRRRFFLEEISVVNEL